MANDRATTSLRREIVETASANWPGIKVGPSEFIAYVEHRVGADGMTPSAIEQLRLGDLWLSMACLSGDTGALAILDERLRYAVNNIDRHLDENSDDKNELLQHLRERLLAGHGGGQPYLAKYGGRSSLSTWLRTMATRQWITTLGKRNRHQTKSLDDAVMDSLVESSTNPETVYLKSYYRNKFQVALRDSLGSLSSHGRVVLRYYLIDGLNIDQIGRIYGVHRATVARWLSKTREVLYKTTQLHLRQKLTVD